ncbi:uncharacterized protein PITG_19193 [Phytophthora infestans T30-4]|uniref:Uncharacterized protein n=1 Tax=Phytophthora infestans (strain T30-4) TaxID=403677 RepID=D0NZJ7_PHYIT|nr:uncharacterized protein PITG_19193 [Phytophthora infestans T30-4]EEY69554.1 hypothetical protein PITG_19193 [Phytophthora infestans T30-4]|eukprot:XP_002997231.1 hypothetical protein PITG_19193 [Phytophthora infestans T30-4]
MSEVPRGQKRRHEGTNMARKRRCVRTGSEEAPDETASSLGGVAVFNSEWRALAKARWTSKQPSTKSLDTRYKYIRPGRRHDGEEGADN